MDIAKNIKKAIASALIKKEFIAQVTRNQPTIKA